MSIQYHVQRILSEKDGSLLFSKRVHGANNFDTICGIELTEMWYTISNSDLDPKKINCPQCKKKLVEMIS